MQQRQDKIIEILTKRKKVEVNTLSEKLGVSKVTIRKDLNILEEQGLLKHTHGFAVLSDPQDLKVRLTVNYCQKIKIAKKAAELVSDGDTIMIESGSVCALLAKVLGESRKHITIITISCFIADFVSSYSNIQVFLTGGKFQTGSKVLVGSLAKDLLRKFHVKYLFLGTDGFSVKDGFYNNNISRAEIGEVMAEQAENVVILTDSSKFCHGNLIHQFSFDKVTEVISDSNITKQAKNVIKKNRIKLKLV